jgi:hypothetical protein
MGEHNPKNCCEEPCSEESFPSLLWGYFDKRCPSKGDTAKIRPYVVRDDHSNWKEKPDHAFKNIINDKVRLSDDQEKRHMAPSELSKLKLVVSLLEGSHEKDKTSGGISIYTQ